MMTIAIVGRTNVGKSTLFNRLIGQGKAIISPIPGTTRDRNYGICEWQGKKFKLIDTGGFEIGGKGEIEIGISSQASIAMKEADAVLFVVDAMQNVTNDDRIFARALHKIPKPVFLIGNKADNVNKRQAAESNEWKKLGFGLPIPVSAANGSGTGDLLELLVKKLKVKKEKDVAKEDEPLKIVFMGKPNVGKSSIMNALLGEERVIVSSVAGTTRGPEDSLFLYNNKPFLLIDTAGLRKKARVERGLEKIGVSASVKALERTDIAVLILDISEEIGAQDKKIAELIINKKRGLVVVMNKMDLIEGEYDKIVKYIKTQIPFLDFAPIIFVSAKTTKNVSKILDEAMKVEIEIKKEITKVGLENFRKNFQKEKPFPKIYKIKQTGTKPPVFELAVKTKEKIHPSFFGLVEKRLRQKFGFIGAPVKIDSRYIKR
jgi:GTP-binding protein